MMLINIFIFRSAGLETLDYYYFADQPTQNNSPDCKKKLNCLQKYFSKKHVEMLLETYIMRT